MLDDFNLKQQYTVKYKTNVEGFFVVGFFSIKSAFPRFIIYFEPNFFVGSSGSFVQENSIKLFSTCLKEVKRVLVRQQSHVHVCR